MPRKAQKKTQLSYALYYFEQGLTIIPCGINKRPLIKNAKEFQSRKPTFEEIKEWWTKWPDANFGWLMNEDFVALDADNEESTKYLSQIITPTNARNRTPKGMHLVFKANPKFTVGNSAVPKLWDQLTDEEKSGQLKEDYLQQNPNHLKIDVRGKGGYIILAPSRNEKGEYTLENPNFDPQQLPEIQLWHLEFIGHNRIEKVKFKHVPKIDFSFDLQNFTQRKTTEGKKLIEERQDLNSTLVKIASQCKKVVWRSNSKITACCPSHADKNPSFFAEVSLHNGEEKLVLHCSSGCSHEQIVRSLGLEFKDLFATRKTYVEELQTKQAKEIDFSKIEELEKNSIETAKKLLTVQQLPEFDFSALPPMFKDYLDDVSTITKASPIITTMSLLVSLSAYAKHKVYMPDYFSELHVNLWCLVLSKSGQHKSTALEKGCLKLKRDEKIRMKTIEERKQYLENLQLHKSSEASINSVQEEIDLLNGLKKQLASTGSWQGLIDDLKVSGGGALILSEFSAWYSDLIKKHNDGLKTRFTDIYDVVHPIIEQTRSNTNYIDKPFVSIASVSTLEFLKDAVSSIEMDVKSGFLSRFLIFYPPSEFEVPPPFPSISTPLEQRKSYKKLDALFDYILFDMPEKKFDVDSLTSEARAFYEEKYHALYKEFNEYEEHSKKWLSGYIKRWMPTFIKLSMLFQLVWDIKSNQIGINAMRSAWNVLEYAIFSTKKVFESDLGMNEYQQKQEAFLDYLARNKGKITWSTMSKSSPLQKYKKLERQDLIDTLVDAGRIEVVKATSKPTMILLKS